MLVSTERTKCIAIANPSHSPGHGFFTCIVVIAILTFLTPLFIMGPYSPTFQFAGVDGLTKYESANLQIVVDRFKSVVDSGELLGMPWTQYPLIANLSIVAVSIDPYRQSRVACALESVIRQLPSHSRVVICHGSDTTITKQKAFKNYIRTGKVILFDLGIAAREMTIRMYSALLQLPVFYNAFGADRMLVFQHDSVLCSRSDHKWEDFLPFDYIGAPWMWEQYGLGNGGLSLRNTKRLAHLMSIRNRVDKDNEDIVISTAVLSSPGSVIPELHSRKQFSVESMYHSTPFGVHQYFKYHFTDEEMATMILHCPEMTWIADNKPSCDAALYKPLGSLDGKILHL